MWFIDTTMLVGAADEDDNLHEEGKELLTLVGSGGGETALVSDLVVNETVTILGRRRKLGAKRATTFARRVLESRRVRCLYLDAAALEEALGAYERYGPDLSFTDSATVVLMKGVGCSTLFSHDAGFDRIPGILRRTRVD